MKKSKFVAVIAAGVMLVSGLLTGCGDKKVDTDALVQSLLNDVSYTQELTQLSEEEVGYYLDVVDGAEVVMYMGNGSTAEEFAVITAKDADTAATMKTNVDTFLADQKDSFEAYIPEEAKRVEDAVVMMSGNYVAFCVSDDAAKAESVIRNAFEQ